MEEELKSLYGRRVHIFYDRTYTTEVGIRNPDNNMEKAGSQSSTGLSGIIERDTDNFIFLKDVSHKVVEGSIGEGHIPEHIIPKRIIMGMLLEI